MVVCRSLSFEPRGKYLATTGLLMQAVIWNVETGQRVVNLGVPNNPTTQVTMAPAGPLMASLSFLGVCIWRPQEDQGKRLQLLITSTGKDSMTPALAGRAPLLTNAPIVHSQLTITGMELSPDGKYVACGGTDKNLIHVELWDLGARKRTKVFVEKKPTSETGRVEQVVFSPSGKSILAVSSNGVTCWHRETGAITFSVQEGNKMVDIGMGKKAMTSPFEIVACSANGRTMATVARHMPIRIWDLPAFFSKPADMPLADTKSVDEKSAAKKPSDGLPAEAADSTQVAPRWNYDAVIASINQMPPHLRQRLLAVANIKDPKRLAKLAIEDRDLNNRITAVRVLADQKLLAKVAAEADHESVRWEAVQKINGDDQPSLLKLIESTKDVRVRNIAISRVKDPELKEKLAGDAQPAGGPTKSGD